MKIVGIDCGKAGGIAGLGDELGPWALVMPPGKEYDAERIWGTMGSPDHVCVEEPPKMIRIEGRNIQSNAVQSLWQCFGIVQGICASRSIPLTVVKAVVWRKAMLPGTPKASYAEKKQSSIMVAKQLFPGVSLLATPRCKKPHDGMAEALLIAEYGRRALGAARNF